MNKKSYFNLFFIALLPLFASFFSYCHTRGDSVDYFYVDEFSDPETKAHAQELTVFVKKLLYDKTTYDADLSAQLESFDMTLYTSPDGKLKIYTWWDGQHGTMICHNSLYQISFDNKFQAGIIEDFVELPVAIHQVKTSKGSVYLVQFYFQESSSIYAIGIKAYAMNKKGELESADVFECVPEIHDTNGGYSDYLYVESYYPLPPSAFCKGGWSDNFFFDLTGKDVYMPYFVTLWEPYLYEVMHDYYHHFEWNGEKFMYDPYLLYNPKLARYLDEDGWLIEEFELGESIVRIEKVENGSYRYIAWKKDKMFSADPDLVISQGWYHELKHEYYFKNGDYEYIFNDELQQLQILYTDPKTKMKREFANYKIEQRDY